MGTSRAWLGGFGELSKRNVYTWKRYSAIETITYFWNVSTISYSQYVATAIASNASQGALRSYSGDSGDVTRIYGYVPTDIQWDPTLYMYKVTSEKLYQNEGVDQIAIERNKIYLKHSGYTIYTGTNGTKYAASYDVPSVILYSPESMINATFSSFALLSNVLIQHMQMTDSPHGESYITFSNFMNYNRTSVAGTFLREVSSTNQTAYPDNGVYNGSFYTKQSKTETEYSQGTYIDTVESESPDTYPVNGVLNGYWYVKE